MTTAPAETLPLPLRARTRAAVERAWERAIAAGALPSMPLDERPAVDIERPANPEHGDFASNLAMRLARPYRRAPLEIAQVLAAEIGRDAEAGPGESPIASAEAAPPGFINLRLTERALEGTIGQVLAAPADWGRVRADPAASGKRRVRLCQSDWPADDRQRPRCVHRRPALPDPRGRRTGRDARVLLQRLRDAGDEPGGVDHRRPCAASPFPRTATTARTSRTLRPPFRTTSWRLPNHRAQILPTSSAAGRAPGSERESRPASSGSASTSTSGRARDRSTATAGSSGRSSGCGPAGTSTSRMARYGSARPRSATTRTGSSSGPTAGRRTSRLTSAT